MPPKPQATGDRRASGRAGKASAVDNPQLRRLSGKEMETEPEAAAASQAVTSSRASRAAKTAALEHPPWASLKPKSRSTAPQKNKKASHKATEDVNKSDKAEKRKRSGSSVAEAAQQKPKKSKPVPAPSRSKVKSWSRAHRAPSIDVDGTDEELDGNYNDSGEELSHDSRSSRAHDGEGSDMSDVEAKRDDIAPHVLQAEEARIIPKRPAEAEPDTPQSFGSDQLNGHSRQSTPASDYPAGPPTSDFVASEFDAPDSFPHEDKESQPPAGSKKNRRQMKLDQERPAIRPSQLHAQKQTPPQTAAPPKTTKKEECEKPGVHAAGEEPSVNENGEAAKLWKERTKLILQMKNKKTAGIGLKEQNPDIQKVIRNSYDFGKLALVVGDPEAMLKMSNEDILKMSNPFSVGGLEKIALNSLIKAADASGYDGEFDIAHRLEDGCEALYISPLVDYVAHRLSLIRSHIKKCITIVAPSILGLSSNTFQHNSNLLVQNSFIYPWSQENGFDTSKPFFNEVIAKSVECAFFTPGSQYNALGLEFAGQLTAPGDAQPGQREVSLFMVALASVAVASVIQDIILGRLTDFTGAQLDSLFKKLLVILLTLRRSKPVTYHKLTHGIYSKAVGEKPVNLASSELTTKEILGEVQWDLIAD